MSDRHDLLAGVAARLQDLEDEDEEIDPAIPSSWGTHNASNMLQSQSQNSGPDSFSSEKTLMQESRSFARAFVPMKRRLDRYQLRDQDRSFSFSTANRDMPQAPIWNSYDPAGPDQPEFRRKSRPHSSQASATDSRGDINDPWNTALGGTFGSTSVKCVVEESSSIFHPVVLNSRLENPDLDIDPNVRANFLTIDQLHRVPAQRPDFAMRNPSMIDPKTGASITMVIAGKTITFTPKARDSRLSHLDRHGEYIGENLGEIKKSLKRQHKEDVLERDMQMLQATAEYRALVAMSAEQRSEFLERLRKPYEFVGAWAEDQYDKSEIPAEYTRAMPLDRVKRWVEGSHSGDRIPTQDQLASATTSHSKSVSNWTPIEDFDEPVEIAAGADYIPLIQPQSRNWEYFQNALYYGRRHGRRPSAPLQQSSSTTRTQSSSTARAQIAHRLNRTPISDTGSRCPQYLTTSSRSAEDPFTFDDSPEFQTSEDTPIESTLALTPRQNEYYQSALTLSSQYPRLVLIQLNGLVRFSPGAITRRVFNGIIQAMQLFPTQRLALVLFLHPSEAGAFVRHVQNTYQHGPADEIRALQIQAGWYRGGKEHAIVPPQPRLLTHHVAENATRLLRLARLPAAKRKEDVSAELGRRLGLPLLTVILCVAKTHYFGPDAPRAREAIVEFTSVADAIVARHLLRGGMVDEYEDCEPLFACEPSAAPRGERPWCSCSGCKEGRRAKAAALRH